MSFKKEDLLELVGGEEELDNLVGESMDEKLRDDGYLMYVSPSAGFKELDYEAMGRNAEAQTLGTKRQVFAEERQKIRNTLNNIFNDLKKPDINSEVRLNPEFAINIAEEDLDYILDAYLDGVDDNE